LISRIVICCWCLRAAFWRWACSYLDEVEVAVLRVAQGLLGSHDSDLLAGLVDEPDLGDPNALVDAGGVALRRLPVEPTRDRH
jgi:hypothetical protein